jgi:Phage integrase, N-terminal SAM-like domain
MSRLCRFRESAIVQHPMAKVHPSAPLLDPLVERYLSQLRVEGGLALNTLESYRRDLSRLQRYLQRYRLSLSNSIPPQIVRSFLTSLKQESLAASSVARILSAMRGWYRFLIREKIVEESPLRDVTAMRRPVRLPKTLTRQEVTALLELPVRDRVEDRRDRDDGTVIRVRSSRVRACWAESFADRPESRLCQGCRERSQGAGRADWTDGKGYAGRVSRTCAPGSSQGAIIPHVVRQQAGTGPYEASLLEAASPARTTRRYFETDLSAHAATFFCDALIGRRGRSPIGSGDVGSCRYCDDSNLHACGAQSTQASPSAIFPTPVDPQTGK